MARVVECINFLHELDLLEAHLDEHQHFMDEIIVLESEVTYSGMPKPLSFNDNKERFSRFNIQHEIVPVDTFEPIPATYPEEERTKWFNARRNNRERQQKYLFEKFKGRGDYICNSDVDEIWSRDMWYQVEECIDKGFMWIAPQVKRFQNYVDSIGKGQEHWRITNSNITTHVRIKGITRGKTDAHVGWHFTSCYKSPTDMWYKGVGLAQSVGYMGWSDVHTPEQLEAQIAGGDLPFMRQKLQPRAVMPLDDITWLPPFMRENKDLWPWLPKEAREGRRLSPWRLLSART